MCVEPRRTNAITNFQPEIPSVSEGGKIYLPVSNSISIKNHINKSEFSSSFQNPISKGAQHSFGSCIILLKCQSLPVYNAVRFHRADWQPRGVESWDEETHETRWDGCDNDVWNSSKFSHYCPCRERKKSEWCKLRRQAENAGCRREWRRVKFLHLQPGWIPGTSK